MNTRFYSAINKFLSESIIDIPKDGLDPTVFQFSDAGYPTMHPAIKLQITETVRQFASLLPINNFYVIGSILTTQYTGRSDIDVNIEVDTTNLNNIAAEALLMLLRKLNGFKAIGTTHSVNYFIVRDGEYDLDNTDAAYDIANERWIKEPPSPVGFKAKEYSEKFSRKLIGFNLLTDELRRDIIDFNELSKLPHEEITELKRLMNEKLNEVEDDITQLIDEYKETRLIRRMAFDRAMTPKEIKKYGSKNRLPENVIYKMLEKYYYWNFIGKIKEIISDGKVTPKEVERISYAGKEMWT